MSNQISQLVLNAVYTRLAAADGYNFTIANQANLYNINPNDLLLDFSATSQNFYFDQIDAAMLEQSASIKYPFACLYILESAHTGEQKFTTFSGLVRCVFEVTLSWVGVRGTQNREGMSNCIEDSVIDIINRVSNQNWGEPLVYNGQIQCRRGPTSFGANNWKKKIGFSLFFGLHQ